MAAYQDHLWLFKYMALIILSKYANLRKYAYIKALHLIIKYRHFTVANQTKRNETNCFAGSDWLQLTRFLLRAWTLVMYPATKAHGL